MSQCHGWAATISLSHTRIFQNPYNTLKSSCFVLAKDPSPGHQAPSLHTHTPGAHAHAHTHTSLPAPPPRCPNTQLRENHWDRDPDPPHPRQTLIKTRDLLSFPL